MPWGKVGLPLEILEPFENNTDFLERVWMVQTEQQYICIHQCLMAVIEGKENHSSPARGEIHDNEGYEGKFPFMFRLTSKPFVANNQVLVTNFFTLFLFSLMHLKTPKKQKT